MLILPTKGRPGNLERFVAAYKATNAGLPVYVVFNSDDAENYNHVNIPEHFKKICAPTGSRLGDIFNMMFRAFPNEDFYGIVADDVVPGTEHWDTILRDKCLPNRIVWGYDGGHNELLPRHPFIGGNLLRKLGWWSVPGLKHCYIDNGWQEIAYAFGVGEYVPEVKMVHFHHTLGLSKNDTTYKEQPNYLVDKLSFESWRRFDLPTIIESVKL